VGVCVCVCVCVCARTYATYLNTHLPAYDAELCMYTYQRVCKVVFVCVRVCVKTTLTPGRPPAVGQLFHAWISFLFGTILKFHRGTVGQINWLIVC